MDLPHIDEIAGAIRVRHVLTPLDGALTLTADTPESVVWKQLSEMQFDAAPILGDGEVTGLVVGVDLEPSGIAPVGTKARQLTSSQLISADTALSTLLAGLGADPLLLVVEGHEIAGLVATSDLNKQPGRTYFYLLISTLEMLLAERLRERFPAQDDLLKVLPNERRRQVAGRLSDLSRRDALADAVSALEFVDVLKVVQKTPELLSRMGASSATYWSRKVADPICELRNSIMHSVRTVADDSPATLHRLQSVDVLLRDLIECASGSSERTADLGAE